MREMLLVSPPFVRWHDAVTMAKEAQAAAGSTVTSYQTVITHRYIDRMLAVAAPLCSHKEKEQKIQLK